MVNKNDWSATEARWNDAQLVQVNECATRKIKCIKFSDPELSWVPILIIVEKKRAIGSKK